METRKLFVTKKPHMKENAILYMFFGTVVLMLLCFTLIAAGASMAWNSSEPSDGITLINTGTVVGVAALSWMRYFSVIDDKLNPGRKRPQG